MQYLHVFRAEGRTGSSPKALLQPGPVSAPCPHPTMSGWPVVFVTDWCGDHKTMICIYHRGDLDGHCSGAIVRHKYPPARMIGLDYEDNFQKRFGLACKGADVCMLDFSLPMDKMQHLKDLAKTFVWIDHHKTAIDKAREAGFETLGSLVVGKAACELTWEFFCPREPMPSAVWLLGRYDVWDEKHPDWDHDILPFQYGLRKETTDPGNPDTEQGWAALFEHREYHSPLIQEFISEGKAIINYQRQQDAKLMARHAFETRLDNVAAMAVNHGPGGSMKFGNIDCPAGLLISFARLPQKKWLVNLYTYREDVDCGEIASRHGGGGHRKAAGFICEELPFEI